MFCVSVACNRAKVPLHQQRLLLVVRDLGFEMSAIVGVVVRLMSSPIRLHTEREFRLWDFVGRVDCHGCPHNLDVLR